MMVLIDRKVNKEQLLFETFFPKMNIAKDIRKKVISRGLKPYLEKAPGGWGTGVFICCLGHHSQNFCRLILQFFLLICPEPRL